MKKIIYLLCTVCFLASCSINNDYEPERKYPDRLTDANRTVKELYNYNVATLEQTPVTRNGRYSKIAKRDVMGAIRGAVMTSSTCNGYIIGFGSALLAAVESLMAYEETRNVPVTIEETTALFDTHQSICRAYATEGNAPEEADTLLLTTIGLPLEFSHLAVLGEYHNGVLTRFLNRNNGQNGNSSDNGLPLSSNSGQTTTRSSTIAFEPLIPIVTDNLPTLFNCPIETIDSVFNDSDFRNACIYDVLTEPEMTTMEEVTNYINSINGISENTKAACCLYLDLFNNCPDDIQTIQQIARGYINIIEQNNEFTPEEKEIIYSGITVSLYSTVLWNEIN